MIPLVNQWTDHSISQYLPWNNRNEVRETYFSTIILVALINKRTVTINMQVKIAACAVRIDFEMALSRQLPRAAYGMYCGTVTTQDMQHAAWLHCHERTASKGETIFRSDGGGSMLQWVYKIKTDKPVYWRAHRWAILSPMNPAYSPFLSNTF